MKKKEIIENILKENINGLTIQELSDKSKFARNTIKVILTELKGENKITIRDVGMAKIHYWIQEDVNTAVRGYKK